MLERKSGRLLIWRRAPVVKEISHFDDAVPRYVLLLVTYCRGFVCCIICTVKLKEDWAIYTKAAGVGADLVGKVEQGIRENDARESNCYCRSACELGVSSLET